jgi:hypothetical protein
MGLKMMVPGARIARRVRIALAFRWRRRAGPSSVFAVTGLAIQLKYAHERSLRFEGRADVTGRLKLDSVI